MVGVSSIISVQPREYSLGPLHPLALQVANGDDFIGMMGIIEGIGAYYNARGGICQDGRENTYFTTEPTEHAEIIEGKE
jgi:hypothetical protein